MAQPLPQFFVGDLVRIRYTGSVARVIAEHWSQEVQYLWVLYTDEMRKITYPTTVISRDVEKITNAEA